MKRLIFYVLPAYFLIQIDYVNNTKTISYINNEKIKKTEIKIQKTTLVNKKRSSAALPYMTMLRKEEDNHKIPRNLLSAIAKVESQVNPWSVSARGKGHYFKSLEEASEFVKQHQERGTRNLFVGCMQLCIRSHGDEFDSVEDLLDPCKNIKYAAQLLKSLYRRHKSWEKAVMYYNASDNMHSYTQKVLKIKDKLDQQEQIQ